MPLFVTVTPGTTITSNTTLDASTLNLLGTPSVDVTGSVDGGSLTLGANSVNNAAIIDGAVDSNKLASGAVIASRIAANAVESAKIAADAVIASKIASDAVTTAKIANDAVTYDKLQNVSTNNRLLGRATSGAGNVEEITIGTNLSLSGTTLNADSQKFASVVFNGAVETTTGINFVTTSGSQIFTTTSHGFSNGDLIWITESASVSSSNVNVALYVTVVDSNTYRLSTSQANRSGSIYISATGASSANKLAHWNSNPILASYNVDGVIKIATGRYSVDFTTNPSNAYYIASGCPKAFATGEARGLFFTESFDVPSTVSYYSVELVAADGEWHDSTLIRIGVFQ
jgi:hypothetical protein